jgi:hypothetical protein
VEAYRRRSRPQAIFRKALELTIPAGVLSIVDEVIE